jgi:hypothetical protein
MAFKTRPEGNTTLQHETLTLLDKLCTTTRLSVG